MDGWTLEAVFYVSCLVIAGLCLAWAATFGLRGLLNDHAPFKQPDGSPGTGVVDPPTSDSVSPLGSAVRCRRRVVLSAPDLGTALPAGWMR